MLAGPGRVVSGTVPVGGLVSRVLWKPFAQRIPQGYSTGDPAARSYHGFVRRAYGFSCGLSMDREHHPKPHRASIALHQRVEHDPERRRVPWRDIWPEPPPQAI